MSPFFSRSELLPFLERMGIRLDKNRGQCFLIDKNIVEFIVQSSNLTQNDSVLEIGPGLGTLSDLIVEKVKMLYMIEHDKKAAAYLTDYYAESKRVSVIHSDCLKVQWPPINKIISNLPYNISGLLFAKLAEVSFERAVFMVQKEFAERLIAPPNSSDYSRLSVMYALYFNVKILKNVANTVFYPKPAVDSAIVAVEPFTKYEYSIPLKPILFHLLHGIFPYKGKMLRRGMKDFINASKKSGFRSAMEEFLEVYRGNDILSKRIRAITPEEYLMIAQDINDFIE